MVNELPASRALRQFFIGAIASLVLCAIGIVLAWAVGDTLHDPVTNPINGLLFGVIAVPIIAGIWIIGLSIGIVAMARRGKGGRLTFFSFIPVLANLIAPITAYVNFIWWPTQFEFVHAAEFGDRRIVERSLRLGLPIDAGAPHAMGFGGVDPGETPLTAAAGAGRLDIVQLLLQHGAGVNAPDGHGNTPLIAAIKAGHSDVAQYLIARGARVGQRSSASIELATPTALMTAIGRNEIDIATRLVLDGADVNHPPTIAAALQREEHAIALLLAQHGADGRATNDRHESAIQVAAEMGYWDVVRELAATAGPDADPAEQVFAAIAWSDEPAAIRALGAHRELLKSQTDSTALLRVAMLAKMHDLASMLLPTAKPGDWHVLQSAAKSGDSATLAMCRHATPEQWNSILSDAATRGDVTEAQSAINMGANVNAEVSQPLQRKYTALYAAAQAGNVEIVKLLLDNGANVDLGTAVNPSAPNSKTDTPLDTAIRHGQVAAARVLLSHNAHGHDPWTDGNGVIRKELGIVTEADYRRVYGP